MPITDAFILAMIVFAFTVFGLVLARPVHQTRGLLSPLDRQNAKSGAGQNGPTTTIRAETGRGKELITSWSEADVWVL
jgi:hypothetical protein